MLLLFACHIKHLVLNIVQVTKYVNLHAAEVFQMIQMNMSAVQLLLYTGVHNA